MAKNESQFQNLETILEDHVYIIKINRPKVYNAIDVPTYNEIAAALEFASQSEQVHVTILTGNGKYYSSGNDLRQFMTDGDPEELAKQGAQVLTKFVENFINFPKILIACVNGPAIGIAVTTLALCDVVYASESATFHTPFSVLGQSPEGTSSILFPSIMGITKANEMLLFGKKLSAVEAQRCGFVSEIFSETKLLPSVIKIAKTIAEYPISVLMKSKKLIREPIRDNLLATNKREIELLSKLWVSPETLEAVVKFMANKKKGSKSETIENLDPNKLSSESSEIINILLIVNKN